jgi:hypothetical protein
MTPPGPVFRASARLSLLLLIVVLTLVCSACRERARLEPLTFQPPDPERPETWVARYDPQRTWSGYTLDLHWARRPVLVDMNGRVVHEWPAARVKSRVKLLPDGNLLGLSLGRGIVEYDWEGELVWSYDVVAGIPHHDVVRTAAGTTIFPVLPDDAKTDDIVEVDQAGEIVWLWHAGEHLADYIDDHERRRADITHINSIQELPDNPWFAAGDRRFRPGNLLISARNLNEIFVIDKETKAVTWSWRRELDLQHEALMIPPGFARPGAILLFDNGYRSSYRYRKSRIVEIHPPDGSVEWTYEADEFYSPTAGVQQPLPNGNVFVGSSRGGRAFELTRGGEIVWQWTPPFEPVRPARYSYDHSPQLAALPRPAERPVAPPAGYRWVDVRLYQFAPRGGLREERLERTVQRVLADNNDCRELLLPRRPELYVTYGVDRGRVAAAGREAFTARFAMTIHPRDGGAGETLFTDTVATADESRWREARHDLAPWALAWVRLCVATEELGAPGAPTEEFAFWSNPAIGHLAATPPQAGSAEEDLTDEELDVRRRHLEALGYID